MQDNIATFKALGDPTRQQILGLLAREELTIAEVASKFDMTRAGVKKHMILLERGNLISVTPRGRERLNRLNPEGFRAITDWLGFFDNFWDEKLNALANVIKDENK
ncbi:transcriptional regulator [Amylibacter marinus]|uniref:Transcriptional regulator n=1 Tax=Amylibacter marinus TaxID=1475483 RepID=A0ABQ5VVE9_9RHOB|nr:metalloregulator ArsR/SmtB family transcription factor [Amylibacter marinus]GLQ35242.1 transcriptional regulator [Amylibacter marinus]